MDKGQLAACAVETPMAMTLKNRLDYEQLTNCMRCGFCLPACPTFSETGIEAESPRGRIALMKAVVDGIMEPDPAFEEQMNHCLGCRACEPACPAGVKYGQLIEQTRDAVEEHTETHRWWVRLVRKLFLEMIVTKRQRLRWLGRLLVLYKATGLRRLARKTGLLRLLPRHLADMEGIMPDASWSGVVERTGQFIPAQGTSIGKVALFRGCIMDILFSATNTSTVELLSEAGFDVVIPPKQQCCGALHAHAGQLKQARELAKTNIRVFREAGVDYIVSNAGGCGAILQEYDHLLHDDPEWQQSAAWFSGRVADFGDLLADKGNLPVFDGSMDNVTVTYQDSCHMRNVMKSGQAQRTLLQRAANVTFVEMKDSERCCGSAGIYNITRPEMAGSILKNKMVHANRTNAHYLITGNPGCLLQMKLGIRQHGDPDKMQAVHLADFLRERIC